MNLSRRRFLEYCGIAAGAIGLTPGDLAGLNKAMANPNAPEVIWLHGSSCTGCSVSLLNRIVENESGGMDSIVPILTDAINLTHHQTLMTFAGESCGAVLEHAVKKGNYILVVEGAIPTAFDGHCCISYTYKGREVTFAEAVTEMAQHASHVICVGTCSSFGGIPGVEGNPTNAISVSAHTGASTINISGCPSNPDWVIWAVVQLLIGRVFTLADFDEDGRPIELYQQPRQGGGGGGGSGVWETIHQSCPRKSAFQSGNFASDFNDTDGKCLLDIGCRGQWTRSKCANCWNGSGTDGSGRWCIGVNAPCAGCVDPSFPDTQSFFQPYTSGS